MKLSLTIHIDIVPVISAAADLLDSYIDPFIQMIIWRVITPVSNAHDCITNFEIVIGPV
jgi:hypothetical protein